MAKILIVDDSPTVRQLLKLGLSRLPGVTCDEAADGREALHKLDGGPFDLVLCDVNMPVLGGLGLLDELRQRPALKELPVIMVTTEGALEDQERALEKGASAYLTKPIQLPRLL